MAPDHTGGPSNKRQGQYVDGVLLRLWRLTSVLKYHLSFEVSEMNAISAVLWRTLQAHEYLSGTP